MIGYSNTRHKVYNKKNHRTDKSSDVVFDKNEPFKITSPNNQIEIGFSKLTLNEDKAEGRRVKHNPENEKD